MLIISAACMCVLDCYTCWAPSHQATQQGMPSSGIPTWSHVGGACHAHARIIVMLMQGIPQLLRPASVVKSHAQRSLTHVAPKTSMCSKQMEDRAVTQTCRPSVQEHAYCTLVRLSLWALPQVELGFVGTLQSLCRALCCRIKTNR